jgi:CRP/FNR family cyclic AMP-dependent transcriptional regulator
VDHVPLFARLDPVRRDRLAARSRVRTVGAGESVARFGEPATHLLVLEAGALVATRDTADGRRLRVDLRSTPAALDKAAVLDGGGHTATWTAVTCARVRLVPAADFHRLLDDVPAVRHHVLAYLATEVRDRQERLLGAHYADATARVAAWLLAAGRERVRLPGGQQGLAETVGVSRITVHRALRRLSAAGIVTVRAGVVVVRDPGRLAGRA